MNKSVPIQSEGIENRRFRRSTVLWPASLLFEGREIDCVILNISANGAKVTVGEALPEKLSVTLRSVRFGALTGEIVWATSRAVGIRFSAPPQDVANAIGGHLPLLPGDAPAR